MYLDAARDAARWIATRPVADATLYYGRAGIVLFQLELHDATGDSSYRDAADAGRSALVDALDDQACGLYDGIAGIGFALGALGDQEGLARAAAQLRKRARRIGRGVLWSDSVDVFGGVAGIGLALVHAARTLGDPALLDLAIRAGVGLIDGGHFRPGRMPNFSHGASGVSYFLATLFRETRDLRFKTAALAGAEHLLAIADTSNRGFRIYHHTPGPNEHPLYYLGWCHGPVGAARLFYRLAQISGDAGWMDHVRRCARAIVASGIPERQAPGLWNNAGQCCGLAGVADFFLQLHAATGDAADREFADRIARHVLERAERTADGLKWTHAEHRNDPGDLEAQTGYMQGAAGIGAMFVHADAAARGQAPSIRLPDSPW